MNAITNTTIKSSIISVGLHASFVLLGSLVLYQAPVKLELTGATGKNVIALSNVNFISKRTSVAQKSPRADTKNISQNMLTKATSVPRTVETGGLNSHAITNSFAGSAGNNEGSGVINGAGNGQDFDQGRLFSQIKNFFEIRLGSTLNISVEQLIKIKVVLDKDGAILSADLIQGKLDFHSSKKILNVAKSIPLKSFWKATTPFPQELVIPLVLTPS